jgi:hypothetical protein
VDKLAVVGSIQVVVDIQVVEQSQAEGDIQVEAQNQVEENSQAGVDNNPVEVDIQIVVVGNLPLVDILAADIQVVRRGVQNHMRVELPLQ